ncbi:MAG: bifunctional glutamate N-acetyltransferase/amino-acid acetyltransferase ArgJ [Planctomycetota bacterium]
MASRSVTFPGGFRAAGGTCGIKESGRPDLCLIVSNPGTSCVAAGVFTSNAIVGAPVKLGRQHLQKRGGESFRGIVCNSGNSNVATGAQGDADALAMCQAAADALGCEASAILPASTGVIGRPLPIEKITAGIPSIAEQLAAGAQADADAAAAILTTDLVAKPAALRSDAGYTLGGIAKGSGMIAPSFAPGTSFATMLAFITTDVKLTPSQAQAALQHAAGRSFGRISVDTDTSTSDTVYLLANGDSGVAIDTDEQFKAFTRELTELCNHLAQQIIRDGEGATKVFAVHVTHAANEEDADAIGRAVAESPLVKTAVHGGDPNWGRLAMAVGKARRHDGVPIALDPRKLVLSIGDTVVYRDEVPIHFTPDVEQHLEAAMAGPDISFTIDLNAGDLQATWFGCDLSRQYVTINADYTT